MDPEFVVCDDDRCMLVLEDSAEEIPRDSLPGQFIRVISDVSKVYPTAILVGAVAAAQYITHSNEPRITYDVDILLDVDDFSDFLRDEIPEETVLQLETYFDDSDSINHSLKHKETGIYVDLLSLESKPIRKKIVKYILENRDKSTNTFQIGPQTIDILKPEFLIAMKLNRYSKKPRSERGLSDRVDIMKVLKALWDGEIAMDDRIIQDVCNKNETACYASILDDVEDDMREREEPPAEEDPDDDFLTCEDDRCVLMAEDFMVESSEDSAQSKFNRVLADLSDIYPDAILVGAVAAAKYIRNPVTPRETHDVDVMLGEKDFAEFLIDEIPEDKLEKLEAHFDTSDSINHSLKHKDTGVYVDLLSTESQPIRKRITRHVLNHREKATHMLLGEEHAIGILRPELLLAMKVNRYCKNPKNDKGLSDRLDIVNILQTLKERGTEIDHGTVKSFLNGMEVKKYNAILADVWTALM